MKALLLLLMASVLAACNGTKLSPERQACLEKAKTEAERIECNKASAIDADKRADDAGDKKDEAQEGDHDHAHADHKH